jgi:hypothetical protein
MKNQRRDVSLFFYCEYYSSREDESKFPNIIVEIVEKYIFL